MISVNYWNLIKILPFVFQKSALHVSGNSLKNPYFLEQNVGVYRAPTDGGYIKYEQDPFSGSDISKAHMQTDWPTNSKNLSFFHDHNIYTTFTLWIVYTREN
jgi:hypothetical protein